MKYLFSGKKLKTLEEKIFNQKEIIEQLHKKNKVLRDKLTTTERASISYDLLLHLLGKEKVNLQLISQDRIVITHDWRSIRIYSLPLEKHKICGELTISKSIFSNDINIILLECFVKRAKFGSNLVDFLIAHARREGMRNIRGEISLNGLEKQPWLIDFYKKFGFVFVENHDFRENVAGDIELEL